MITDKDFQNMIKAKVYAEQSTCQRRKIGVYIPIGSSAGVTGIIAANHPQSTIQCCLREQGICPALHAEVNAVMNLGDLRYKASTLYVFAETPCHQCLSFIRRNSHISNIVCLQTESYGKVYPRVLDRTKEIALRDKYAIHLGFQLIKIDLQEVIEYELSQYSKSESS